MPFARVPERWIELSLAAPPPGEAPLLVDALRRVGARAVERSGDRVVALLPPPADPAALVTEAGAAIRASTSIADPALSWRWRNHGEWAAEWRTAHPPTRVTERIVVAPTGSEWRAEPGELVVRLDPAVAFGTAEHPTTRACLRRLDSDITPGDRVLDIGAGSGILSIAAALLGARRVLALEADGLACAAARANAVASGVGERITVRERRVGPRDLRRLGRRGLLPLRRASGRFDAVLANLDADTLVRLAPALPGLLAPGGWVLFSGVLRVERTVVLEAGERAGLRLDVEEMERGWWTGRLSARGATGSGDGRWRGS